jgi:sulfur-carrier protein
VSTLEANQLPVVGIPSLLRDLTNGERSVSIEGDTIQEVIENLNQRYPGLKERLCDGEQLRPSIAVVVDGATSPLKLRHKLNASSEVHFVVSISGG